ncbi:MAG: hypothetical protein Q7S60_03720 [bacterium]|nr:hypothetical protein [bacterium]
MTSPSTIWRQHKTLNADLNKVGKLLVWTKNFVPSSGFEHQIPYIVGIVQFEDGERKPLQIVDCDEKNLKPNQKVITVIRKIGKVKQDEVIEYGIKAKPA